MTDATCTVCRVPKPPCCFEYANKPRNAVICQPCHRDAEHNRRAARERTPQAHAKRLERTNRILAEKPDRYADGIATSVERSGA